MPKKTKLESEIGKPYVPKISEDQLQKQVAAYLTLRYPQVIWFHTPNGGSRNFFEACKLKLMGVKPGVPDLMILARKGGYYGLAVELKVGKNKTTDSQTEWLQNLEILEWKTAVCYTFDSAKQIIDEYLLS